MKKLWNKLGEEPGVARRADTLFQKGNKEEALRIAGEALLRGDDPALMKTVDRWLNAPGFSSGVPEQEVCRFAAFLTRALDRCEESRRASMQEKLLEVLRGINGAQIAARDDITDWYAVVCMLLRHMDRQEEALQTAFAGLEAHRSPYCATFAGACYMDLDNEAEAERYTRMGVELSGGNAAGYNDFADYLYRKGDYRGAMRFYRLVLDSGDRDHGDAEWAESSFLFCRYLLEQDKLDLERLAAFAALRPENGRIRWMLDQTRQMQLTP